MTRGRHVLFLGCIALASLLAASANATLYYSLSDPDLIRPGASPWLPWVDGTTRVELQEGDTLWVGMDNFWVRHYTKWGFIEVDYSTQDPAGALAWTSHGEAYDPADLGLPGGPLPGPLPPGGDDWYVDGQDHFVKVNFQIWDQPSWEWIDVTSRLDNITVTLVKGQFECERTVPEPASCALLVVAVGGIGAMLRRRRR